MDTNAHSGIRRIASAGDISAIALLINRAVHKKGITATVDLEDGDLHIILDAQKVPPEQAADFILNGVKKLEIEPAFTVKVFGRIAGQPFATWHRKFELKPKPFGRSTPSLLQNKQQAASSNSVSIRVGENIVQLDTGSSQTLGFIGISILVIGIFTPMMSAPVVGTLSYFRDGSEEAIALLVLSAFSLFFLKKEYYSWLYGPATWSFLIVAFTFYHYYSVLSDAKNSITEEASGGWLGDLAGMAAASMRLEWGWMLLFAGSILVLFAAYQKRRSLDKQAFLSIGNFFAGAVLFAIAQVSVLAVQVWANAPEVDESEAKTYVGSINRGQQVFYLEDGAFANDIDSIGIDLPTGASSGWGRR